MAENSTMQESPRVSCKCRTDIGKCGIDIGRQGVHSCRGRESDQCDHQRVLDQVLSFFLLNEGTSYSGKLFQFKSHRAFSFERLEESSRESTEGPP